MMALTFSISCRSLARIPVLFIQQSIDLLSLPCHGVIFLTCSMSRSLLYCTPVADNWFLCFSGTDSAMESVCTVVVFSALFENRFSSLFFLFPHQPAGWHCWLSGPERICLESLMAGLVPARSWQPADPETAPVFWQPDFVHAGRS